MDNLINDKDNSLNDLKYEDAVKRLEEIVTILERGEASLDLSMDLFREGVALSSFCERRLQTMKEEMVKLVDASGSVEPIDGVE
ncbi:MAG: exodeoxyribonuclease VII small subunit [Clostridiaceae bacterium]|nr:exodeoxyribonuclease VII small subunit [Clostridiaceae bacterium]